MAHRDRAAGWQYAKLSGHKNEALVKNLLDNDPEYAKAFLCRLGLPGETIKETSIGGLHETNVSSITGKRKTKSKTDLKIFLNSGKEVNISIKKSLGGQVYFVRSGIFIETFETQFGKTIPETVKRAINLFWAAADDAIPIIEQYADRRNAKNYDLQIRHASLNAATLKNYSESLYNDLLDWFTRNAYELTALSFAMGAVRDPEEWSDFVWYINLLEENDVDAVFSIPDLCKAAAKVASEETYYSTTNGGTTIQLPFGFVQWHQRQLQFHHNFDKVSRLLGRFL